MKASSSLLRRLCLAIGLFVVLVGVAPRAMADFQAGVAALNAGDGRAAIAAWRPLAEAGDREAAYALGWLYHTGAGRVEQRFDLAKRWYEQAAREGHTDAQFALGQMYRNGQGVRRDYQRAREWYLAAVRWSQQRGHAQAEYALGQLYFSGLGVPRDFGEAVFWYTRAAYHDHPGAQFVLGAIYEAGWGAPQSHVEAYYWYTLAARHGAEALARYVDVDVKAVIEEIRERLSVEELKEVRRLYESRRIGSDATLPPLGRRLPVDRY